MNRKPHPKRKDRPRTPGRPSAPAAQHQKTDWHGVHEWYDRLVGDAGSERFPAVQAAADAVLAASGSAD